MKVQYCKDKECVPPYGEKEDCELNQNGVCAAVPVPCCGCHWHHPEDLLVKCSNLSMDNWKAIPEGRCEEFVLSEDYNNYARKPTP